MMSGEKNVKIKQIRNRLKNIIKCDFTVGIFKKN